MQTPVFGPHSCYLPKFMGQSWPAAGDVEGDGRQVGSQRRQAQPGGPGTDVLLRGGVARALRPRSFLGGLLSSHQTSFVIA